MLLSTGAPAMEAPAPDVPAVEPAPAAPAVQDMPYLGLVVVPTTPEARAQLKLPQGIGLTIAEVVEGSPAEEAGLQQHDILHKLGDQILVNPQQLGTLVQMHGSGAAVSVTLYRAGESMQLPVTVGKTQRRDIDRAVRQQIRFGPAGLEVLPVDPDARVMVGDGDPLEAQLPLIEAQLERLREELKHARLNAPDAFQRMEQLRQDGNAQHMTRTTRMADAQHVIELRTANNSQTLKVTDAQGEVLFEGPYNTKEERAAVPAELLEKVQRMEQRVNVRVQLNPRGQLRLQQPAPQNAQPEPAQQPEPVPAKPMLN